MISMSKFQHGIQNIELTYVLVKSVGVVSSSDVISDICPVQTGFVTLMIANNMSGELQPVVKVATHCQGFRVLFHTDAAQAVIEAPVDLIGNLGEAEVLMLVVLS